MSQVINGKKPSPTIINAISLHEMLQKIPPESPLAEKIRNRIQKLLKAKSWQKQSDYCEFLSARLAGDSRREMGLYVKSQNPIGPIYEQIKKEINKEGSVSPAPLVRKTQKIARVKAGFGVAEEGDKKTGPALRIINDGETFVIYPKRNHKARANALIFSGIFLLYFSFLNVNN